jgi:RNA polymerase sigma-70 factor (ECF subfamily)
MSERVESTDGGADDATLVRRHLEGDPDAFRALYEKYGEKVFASAVRIVGEPHAAADLVQEIFVKIHGELRTFKFESKFSTWLFRVAVNHALNKASEVARHARIRERIGREGRGDLGGTREGRPLDDEVHRAIQGLSPKLRAIISLRYLDGLSYEEIAEVLEISMGTVKSRLFLAHETLRPLLRNVTLEEKE